MALSGGHWDTLAEVAKLTQATLIPGVVQEDVQRNNPLAILPMAQANHTGDEIQWLRENTDKMADADVANVGIGTQTVWTEGVGYNVKTMTLKACYIQRKLDKFIPSVYGTFNNYEEIVLKEMLTGTKKKLGKKIVYDDLTYGSDGLQFDGLHAIAAEQNGKSTVDIDMGETALSIAKWRELSDNMKHGVDFWLIPFCIGRWIDAALQEKGFAGLATATAGTMGVFSWGLDQFGGRILYFDGKPILRSDFLVAEQVNTGQGSDARALYSSGTRMYSIFGIKRGTNALTEEDPGLKFAFGKTESDGDLVNLEYFDKLENYIGKGMRVSAYSGLIAGSTMAVGRIHDITDAAITV